MLSNREFPFDHVEIVETLVQFLQDRGWTVSTTVIDQNEMNIIFIAVVAIIKKSFDGVLNDGRFI